MAEELEKPIMNFFRTEQNKRKEPGKLKSPIFLTVKRFQKGIVKTQTDLTVTAVIDFGVGKEPNYLIGENESYCLRGGERFCLADGEMFRFQEFLNYLKENELFVK